MASSKDAALYGFQRQKRMRGDKEISSNTSLSFTSQLSSLINTPSDRAPTKSRSKPKKENIFTTHNLNTAKRAKRDLEDSAAFATQKHTTHGEGLDKAVWERSRRKMEEKARLYSAMKRGDVEDVEGRFGVDFDRKWAEREGEDLSEQDDDDEEEEQDDGGKDMVEYVDEFGRTRKGTKADAARIARQQRAQAEMEDDTFTARPSAPSKIIHGDTIQHQAFNPDFPVSEQMAELAKKRDRSLTPPPDLHFDAQAEVRQKGTGFFQFSGDAGERKKQMEELEKERAETERVRRERYKRKADDFLDELGGMMEGGGAAADVGDVRDEDGEDEVVEGRGKATAGDGGGDGMDAMQRIEAALAREAED